MSTLFLCTLKLNISLTPIKKCNLKVVRGLLAFKLNAFFNLLFSIVNKNFKSKYATLKFVSLKIKKRCKIIRCRRLTYSRKLTCKECLVWRTSPTWYLRPWGRLEHLQVWRGDWYKRPSIHHEMRTLIQDWGYLAEILAWNLIIFLLDQLNTGLIRQLTFRCSFYGFFMLQAHLFNQLRNHTLSWSYFYILTCLSRGQKHQNDLDMHNFYRDS